MWYSGATCWLNATLTLYSGHLSIVDKTPGPTDVHYGQVVLYIYCVHGAVAWDAVPVMLNVLIIYLCLNVR